MEQAIRAARRDSIEAALGTIKYIVEASQTCHNKSLEVTALIDEDDKDNITAAQLEDVHNTMGTVINNLAAIISETITATVALAMTDRFTGILTDTKSEDLTKINL